MYVKNKQKKDKKSRQIGKNAETTDHGVVETCQSQRT